MSPQIFYLKNKSVLPWSLGDLCNIYDERFGDGYGLTYYQMQNHKELGWGRTISCEKHIVYIASSSSSLPLKNPTKKIILYCVYMEQ